MWAQSAGARVLNPCQMGAQQLPTTNLETLEGPHSKLIKWKLAMLVTWTLGKTYKVKRSAILTFERHLNLG